MLQHCWLLRSVQQSLEPPLPLSNRDDFYRAAWQILAEVLPYGWFLGPN
jgi:hypothetical protein